MISCTRNGINTARLSVVSVRNASIFRCPIGSAVFSPSICWYLRTAIWHRFLLAIVRRVSVSASSCFLLSAVCTSVSTANIILWSRVVRSSRNSLLSLLCCSISYGITAEKLLFAFCRLCQFVMFVSTPSSLFSTSRTASSVGIGMISMLIIRLRFKSVSSAIMLSLI